MCDMEPSHNAGGLAAVILAGIAILFIFGPTIKEKLAREQAAASAVIHQIDAGYSDGGLSGK